MDTLENSIREESERIIGATKEKERSEIKELEETCAKEIEDFRKKTEAETAEKIAEELSKLENKSILERKKFKLQALEDFISHIVEDAVKEIRKDRRYKPFLTNAVTEVRDLTGNTLKVSLGEKDRIFENELREVLTKAGSNRNIIIEEDRTIKWGGAIVHDEEGGRIFNNSIERIYFRKARTIHREVLRILKQRGFAV